MTLFLFFYAQTMQLVNYTQQRCYAFPKNFIPRQDSNPGLLSMRRMRCPMRHAPCQGTKSGTSFREVCQVSILLTSILATIYVWYLTKYLHLYEIGF
jgi:hypothetical protein